MADISNSKLLQIDTGILKKNACVVIVRTEWNAGIVDELEAGCRRVLEAAGVQNISVLVVPGAVEIPFAINAYVNRAAYEAEAFIARKKILDQVDDAEPSAQQHQSAGRGPEQRAPAKAAPGREQRRIDRHRQLRRVGLGRDLHRAARGPACIVRVHHDHAGIVELERRRPPVGRLVAHCSRSPIRNWRARSRRM